MAAFKVVSAIVTFVCLFLEIECSFQAKKIVFFPMPMGNSPYFIFLRMAEELQARGHMPSVLSTNLVRKKESIVKHVEYPVNITKEELYHMKSTHVKSGKTKEGMVFAMPRLLKLQADNCEFVLKDPAALKELKDADIIVSLSLVVCSTLISEYLKKPLILVHPAAFNIFGFLSQTPLPPSYVPLIATSDQMTFMERTVNFLAASVRGLATEYVFPYYFKEFSKKYNIKKTFAEISAEAEMHIVTSDFAVEFSHPLMPNVFYIGPVLPNPPKKLPAELEKIMQESGEDGVVLISFGSEVEAFNDNVLFAIAEAASKLKQTVVWKFKLPEHIKVSSNVKLLEWIPQNDILGHEKTKAFVSHMGANGGFEAAYHGVPLIAACVWSDNFGNAQRYIHKAKMAKLIDVFTANASEWLSTMEEVVNNPSYKMNAMRVSKLTRSHPRTPVQQAGDLIEYTLANGGRLPHLKSHAFNLTWYQYLCLDVVAFLAGVFILVTFILIKLVKFIYRKFKGIRTKDKLKKN